MENVKKLVRYFRPYKTKLFLGVFFILASTVFSLLSPFLVGRAIDDLKVVEQLTWQKIVFYPLVILATNLISGIFLFFQRRLIINMSRDIEYDMRRELYQHLINQPLQFFQITGLAI